MYLRSSPSLENSCAAFAFALASGLLSNSMRDLKRTPPEEESGGLIFSLIGQTKIIGNNVQIDPWLISVLSAFLHLSI